MLKFVRREMSRNAHAAAAALIVAAVPVATRTAHAQVANVSVIEVPLPQTLVTELRQLETPPTDLLLNAVQPGRRTFLTIATRDAGWLGELRAGATPIERQRFVETAAGVLEEAGLSPVVSPAYRQLLSGLQRRLREETGGLVTFDHRVLGARDLVSPATVSMPEPAVSGTAPSVAIIARPASALVRSSFLENMMMLIGALAMILASTLWWRRKRSADDQLLQNLLSGGSEGSFKHAHDGASSRNVLSPRLSAVGTTSRHRVGGKALGWSAHLSTATGSTQRSPNHRRSRAPLVIALALFTMPQIATAQARGTATRGALKPVVDFQAAQAATHAAASHRSVAVGRSNVPRIAVDVSGSIHGPAVNAARRIAAVFLADGATVELNAFGDSLVRLGDVTSTSEADSLLAAQPRHRRTRLGEAILALLDTVQTPHRPRLNVIISDLQPDAAGDQSLWYIPDEHVVQRGENTRPDSLQSKQGGTLEDLELATAASLAALLLGLTIGRRDEQQRREWVAKNIRFILRGGSGRARLEVPWRELTDPLPLFATDVVSRHQPFVLSDAVDIELSTSFSAAGATILLAPRASTRHHQLSGGIDA